MKMTEKMVNAKNIMDENRAAIEEMIPKFNEAGITGDVKTMASLSEKMDDLEGRYNESAKVYAFEVLTAGKKAETVIKDVANALRFDCIRVTEKKDPKTKIVSRDLNDVTKPIDPLEVQKYVGVSIAPNKDWHHAIERFNFRLTLRLAKKLGMSDKEIMKINDSYSMSKINEQYRKSVNDEKDEEGNPIANPVSNSQMIKEMQSIVDMCLGEGYKVTSHDVSFLIACYGKKDNKKGLSITASTHKQVRMTFMDVMNNIMNYSEEHSGYSVNFKAKKEADKTPTEEEKKTFTPTGNTAKTEKPEPKEPTLKAEKPKSKSKSKSTPKEEKPVK